MNPINKQFPTRKIIRLKGYDYSQNGLYFITICTQNHLSLFGNIDEKEMLLNDSGKMLEKWWFELENKYPNIALHSYIIMPNHFHGIIEIQDTSSIPTGEHTGSPLPTMIQWFKTMTTNAYIQGVRQKNWYPFHKKLWQKSFHEHIIRDEKSYLKISQYIETNPENWEEDTYFI